VGISRRAALKGLAVAGSSIAAASTAKAAPIKVPPADAMGLLYDATKCIGCKACATACRTAGGFEPERDPSGLYDAPPDLSGSTRTVIKLYREDGKQSFVKAQCMHCVDPACAGACMLGALQKREFGIVTYRADLCIGCRYCQVACPYNVPKFEWSKAAPKIVKCEMCVDRVVAGRLPACVEVCPRNAVISGPRESLLAEARRRLAASPDKYVPKIYGETEGGGTQVLYLSHVPFEKLGLPALGEQSVPAKARSVQHAVYRGFVAPVATYGLLAALTFRTRRTAAWRTEKQDGRP
jgi:Fe-S-cluster-containing dehydrogenase component